MIGIGIHFPPSFLLADVFIRALWAPYLRRHGAIATLVAGPFSLAIVWALNFFVVLPAFHPAFVGLLPYTVTLISTLLFGLALFAVLIARAVPAPVIDADIHAIEHMGDMNMNGWGMSFSGTARFFSTEKRHTVIESHNKT